VRADCRHRDRDNVHVELLRQVMTARDQQHTVLLVLVS
jgi:hypothetical protein